MDIFIGRISEIKGPHSDKGEYVAIVTDKTFKVTILFCQNDESLSEEGVFPMRCYPGPLMTEIRGFPIISFEYDGRMGKDNLDDFICSKVFGVLDEGRLLLDKLTSQVHRRRFSCDGIPVSG